MITLRFQVLQGLAHFCSLSKREEISHGAMLGWRPDREKPVKREPHLPRLGRSAFTVSAVIGVEIGSQHHDPAPEQQGIDRIGTGAEQAQRERIERKLSIAANACAGSGQQPDERQTVADCADNRCEQSHAKQQNQGSRGRRQPPRHGDRGSVMNFQKKRDADGNAQAQQGNSRSA
ncbi:MAG TPA: hypothetical protein VF928_09005 [Usitatibacteraceae bacterium]